jgi:hypothetical protein
MPRHAAHALQNVITLIVLPVEGRIYGGVRRSGRSHRCPRFAAGPTPVTEHEMKMSDERSLRSQVEKWLAPGAENTVRVILFSRTHAEKRRYVCIQASHPAGSHALFFFRHEHGCWGVCPPRRQRPSMTAEPISA